MKVTELSIPGVLLIEPKAFGDQRGFFLESWQKERYAKAGIPGDFVQDNLSRSTRGVLRGMHLQHPFSQAKLVGVAHGAVLDVAIDVRVGSPTFGRWVGAELSGDNHHQLYVPKGCAHGFCVLSEWALFSYKCDDNYHPEAELGVRYNDPDVGIAWPDGELALSDKDLLHPLLRDIPEDKLPRFAQL
jgi:dTDP-4-dehydrorhamnose 3,5-epimerase